MLLIFFCKYLLIYYFKQVKKDLKANRTNITASCWTAHKFNVILELGNDGYFLKIIIYMRLHKSYFC